ncbi:hypothetical protein N825_37575 [Skermanella stibiiresistens SB22]|uniref:Transposase n=1 Tax=Skermanella stibiiresistens SB22 TaxID=1385369 RepID=W9GPL7_9PROT|nr:transposase [Skermanella stibiiresistens]EWY35684.1 hypothetical protein N825_37575 [Skermanella stibiiresistens SB22]
MVHQRVEILTGSERRLSYTQLEMERIVEEAFRPGVIVKDMARRLGFTKDGCIKKIGASG